MARKPSFFEKLTGAVRVDDDYDDTYDDGYEDSYHAEPYSPDPYQRGREPRREERDQYRTPHSHDEHAQQAYPSAYDTPEEPSVAQLAIDLYETASEIIIHTMVAGVHPEDLEISITREVVTIEGRREVPASVPDSDYDTQELYWGPFSRRIELPAEVEVEEAEATETHGLLIITLPKIDKERSTKLKIKSK